MAQNSITAAPARAAQVTSVVKSRARATDVLGVHSPMATSGLAPVFASSAFSSWGVRMPSAPPAGTSCRKLGKVEATRQRSVARGEWRAPGGWPARALAAAALVVATGCATLPIRTALELRKVTPEMLLAAAPKDVRAAVEIDRRAGVDTEASNLVVTLIPRAEKAPVERHSIPVRRVASEVSVHPDLPRADSGRYWTVLGVSAEGREALEEIQRRLGGRLDEYRGVRILVQASFGDLPEDLEVAFPLEVWVRLLPEQGFLKLYGGTFDLTGGPGEC